MKLLLKTFAVALLIFAAACNQSAQKPEVITKTPANTNEIAEASINVDVAKLGAPKDVVCGMTLKQGNVGDTATYNGKLYGFCSNDCKQEFLKNPAGHLK